MKRIVQVFTRQTQYVVLLSHQVLLVNSEVLLKESTRTASGFYLTQYELCACSWASYGCEQVCKYVPSVICVLTTQSHCCLPLLSTRSHTLALSLSLSLSVASSLSIFLHDDTKQISSSSSFFSFSFELFFQSSTAPDCSTSGTELHAKHNNNNNRIKKTQKENRYERFTFNKWLNIKYYQRRDTYEAH